MYDYILNQRRRQFYNFWLESIRLRSEQLPHLVRAFKIQQPLIKQFSIIGTSKSLTKKRYYATKTQVDPAEALPFDVNLGTNTQVPVDLFQ